MSLLCLANTHLFAVTESPNLCGQAQAPGPQDRVQDTTFMHEAFLDDHNSSQLAIASPSNVYTIRFA